MNKALFGCASIVAVLASIGCSAGDDAAKTTASQSQAFSVSGHTVTGQFQRDVSLDLEVDFSCDRTKTSLTWSGTWILKDVSAKLRLQNNTKGTHTTTSEEVLVSLAVEPETAITIDKKGSVLSNPNAAMGNPWIYFMPTKNDKPLLSAPLVLGRCNGGGGKLKKHFDFTALASLLMNVRPDPEDNNACTKDSTNIYVDGTLETVLGEIEGNIWFQQNSQHRSADEETTLQFTLFAEAHDLTFAKRPPAGGAGGNPLVSVCIPTQGVDCADNSDPWLILGRCNKL